MTLTVGAQSADITGTTNREIQEAINQVAGQGGGCVRLLAGSYTLFDSIHLQDNVCLVGSGGDTVLCKPPSRRSEVMLVNGYGLYSIMVQKPELFSVGEGVCVTDALAGGFYDTVATICWIDGQELGLSRPLNHDISAANGGSVTTVYPCISAVGVKNAGVRYLAIEGNRQSNAPLGGCRGAGIYLLQSQDIVVYNVTVHNFNGEGVSFQQCREVLVEACTLEGNSGNGLHPGSGSVGFTFRGVTCRGNGLDGIFYCLQVSHSLCEDSVLAENVRHGISIGHRDTDALIRGNRIEHNGSNAIFFREDAAAVSGDRTVIEGNLFSGNCVLEGDCDILLEARAEDVRILDSGATVKATRDEYLAGICYTAPPHGAALPTGEIPVKAYRHLGPLQPK